MTLEQPNVLGIPHSHNDKCLDICDIYKSLPAESAEALAEHATILPFRCAAKRAVLPQWLDLSL